MPSVSAELVGGKRVDAVTLRHSGLALPQGVGIGDLALRLHFDGVDAVGGTHKKVGRV